MRTKNKENLNKKFNYGVTSRKKGSKIHQADKWHITYKPIAKS